MVTAEHLRKVLCIDKYLESYNELYSLLPPELHESFTEATEHVVDNRINTMQNMRNARILQMAALTEQHNKDNAELFLISLDCDDTTKHIAKEKRCELDYEFRLNMTQLASEFNKIRDNIINEYNVKIMEIFYEFLATKLNETLHNSGV